MKRLHVFRSGTHRTSGGRTLSFSEQDVSTSAAVYDPALCKAPLVIGHPKGGDAPAFGYAASFSAEDGNLYAETERVPQEVIDWAEAGHITGLSASFYTPQQATNPVPGTYYPRHIGLLGQQQPAIKGLDNWPNFSEEGDEEAAEIVLDFAEVDEGVDFADAQRSAFVTGRMMRKLRDFFISQFGMDTANDVLPNYWIQDLEDEGRSGDPSFSEEPSPAEDLSDEGGDADPPTDATDPPMGKDSEKKKKGTETPSSDDDRQQELSEREQQLADREAALEERESTLDERESSVSEQEAEAQRAAHEDFAEALVEDGARILPRHKRTVVAVQNALAGGEESVDFSEEGGEENVPALDAFQRFLSELPPNVDFSEVSAPGAGGEDVVDTADAGALAQAAVDFQEERRKAGQTISMSEAVRHVKNQRAA